MFDLEKAILDWRKEMTSGGIKSPALLDELESHLRDEIAEQSARGTEAQEAFARAAQGIGRAEILRKEFKKNITLGRILRQAARRSFRFAGVPNPYIDTAMNDSSTNPESRWATYLRSAAFAAPAMILWMLAADFIMPKLNEVWNNSAVPNAELMTSIYRFNFGLIFLIKDHLFIILLAMIIALGLLEWRSKLWNRLRRITFGTGVFLLNLAALLSFFVMFLAATLAASVLLQHVK